MDISDYSVDDLLIAAKVAESAERFDDMCRIIKKMVAAKSENGTALTTEERNLLSVAYKNVVGSKRQTWRIMTTGSFQLEDDILKKYKKIVENELETICNEVIKLLKSTTEVAKNEDENGEDVVFYLKMSGDYYRYLSEIKNQSDYPGLAKEFYQQATEIAKTKLAETHPTRLGLALNYSVCCYEILEQKDVACEIAKDAFDAAIEKLDTLNDSSYKDSTLIMQLLRDNLTLWTSENDEAEVHDTQN